MVTLPDGVDACDIGTITVWCQPFRAIFTRLAIPRNIFVRDSEREGGKEGGGEREVVVWGGGGGVCGEFMSSKHMLLSRNICH